MSIHPSAVVHEKAMVHPSASVGPFSVVHENVEIGANCVVGPYVEINHARVGEGTRIGSHSIIGGDPQMLNWNPLPSLVRIGKNCDIREMVTIHRSKDEGRETAIGDDCMIMTNSHIGHDCVIGNNVIITTYAGLSGHVEVHDHAIVGGHAGIHQFVRIGEYSMIGGMARIVQDVAPYMLAEGSPAEIRSTNAIGLKRKGFSARARGNIKAAFRILFRSGNGVDTSLEELKALDDEAGEVEKIISFVSSGKRGLTGV